MLARPDGNASPVETNSNEGRFRTRSELRSDSRWLDTGRIPGADWYEIAGLETIFNYAALQLVGEQQFNWVQRDDSTRGTGPDVFFHGGYFYVAYFLTGEHVPIDRESSTIERTKPFENFFLVERLRGGTGTGWGAWQVALRMSYLDLSYQDIQGGVGRNVTLGLNWWWNSHARLQVNLVRGNITEHRPQGGFTAGDFWALGTRMAVDF
jgi:phosphate-selective porin OprO/OprP